MDRVNGNVSPTQMHLEHVVTLMKAHIIWIKNTDQVFSNGKAVILMLEITIWTNEKAMVLCDGQMVVFTWECGKMVFKAASAL